MIVTMIDRNGNLRAKDLLDINLDMSIVEVNNMYRIRLNKSYYLEEVFANLDQAETTFHNLIELRNEAEEELRLYS